MLAALIDGMDEGGASSGAGADRRRSQAADGRTATAANRNGTNLATALSIMEMCWGDVGLLLTMPRPGPRQLARSPRSPTRSRRSASRASGPRWRSPSRRRAPTPPRSAPPRSWTATSTSSTARRSSSPPASAPTSSSSGPASTRQLGRAAIKSFVVERSNPGMKLDRLEHKLGIRASDTAAFILEDCRVPEGEPARQPRDRHGEGLRRASCRRSTTRARSSPRWRSASRAPASSETRELLEEAGVEIDSDRPADCSSRGRRRAARAGGRLRGRAAADAGGGLDGRQRQAELAAGVRWPRRRRAGPAPTSRCAASSSAAPLGIGEDELLEKWARDAKILDIFEGTQQIQLLIIARQLLGLTLVGTQVDSPTTAFSPHR